MNFLQHSCAASCHIDMSAHFEESFDLIDQVLSKKAGAFEQLIEQYKRLVAHMVFRMVSNKSDREDIAQDVFLKVYKNLRQFRRESKLSTWIARIAFNTCSNYLDKKQVPLFEDIAPNEMTVDSVASGEALPDRNAELTDISERLRTEIDKLPVHYRTIVTLYHLEEMTYREIGNIMNLPEGTVKSHLFRGRRLLKCRLMAKYQPEDLWATGT